MKTNKVILAIIGMVCTLLIVHSCKKEEKSRYGTISMRLTDAPGIYDQVNVDIQKVSVHLVPDIGSASWIDLPTKVGIYDLIKLQNGIDTTLVNTSTLASGKITQMRLLLGSKNTVMVDSVIHNLTVPSGSQTGIKLIGQLMVDPNIPLVVVLDFDAQESVVDSGNGSYHLKPTIKTL